MRGAVVARLTRPTPPTVEGRNRDGRVADHVTMAIPPVGQVRPSDPAVPTDGQPVVRPTGTSRLPAAPGTASRLVQAPGNVGLQLAPPATLPSPAALLAMPRDRFDALVGRLPLETRVQVVAEVLGRPSLMPDKLIGFFGDARSRLVAVLESTPEAERTPLAQRLYDAGQIERIYAMLQGATDTRARAFFDAALFDRNLGIRVETGDDIVARTMREVSGTARVAMHGAKVSLYVNMVEGRLTDVYGSSSPHPLAVRRAAAATIAPALDGQGPAVFVTELNSMLAEPRVRGFLDAVDAGLAVATPEQPYRLFDEAVRYTGSRAEAMRYLAVVFQDYSTLATNGGGFMLAIRDVSARRRLHQTIVRLAAAVRAGNVRPLPDGAAPQNTTFYHYYVPAHLAQRMVERGAPRDLAFMSAATFNLEYGLLVPALKSERFADIVRFVGVRNGGRSLDAPVPDDARASVVAGSVLENGSGPEVRAALMAAPGLTGRMIAATLHQDFVNRSLSDMTAGDMLAGGGVIARFMASSTSEPVELDPTRATDIYAGFAGAAEVLRGHRVPWEPMELLEGIARDPRGAMRGFYGAGELREAGR